MKRYKYVRWTLGQQYGNTLPADIVVTNIDTTGYVTYVTGGNTSKVKFDTDLTDGLLTPTNIVDSLSFSGSTPVNMKTGTTQDINIINELAEDVTSEVAFTYPGSFITSIGANGLITASANSGTTLVTATHPDGPATTFSVVITR